MDQNVVKNSRYQKKQRNISQFNRKKRPPPKGTLSPKNQIYITNKSNYKAQEKQCDDLFNSGEKEIYLHCLGNAINRGINLALNIVDNSNNTLTYEINTSTIELIDECHPLCDDKDIVLENRKNSSVHIRISRNCTIDIK